MAVLTADGGTVSHGAARSAIGNLERATTNLQIQVQSTEGPGAQAAQKLRDMAQDISTKVRSLIADLAGWKPPKDIAPPDRSIHADERGNIYDRITFDAASFPPTIEQLWTGNAWPAAAKLLLPLLSAEVLRTIEKELESSKEPSGVDHPAVKRSKRPAGRGGTRAKAGSGASARCNERVAIEAAFGTRDTHYDELLIAIERIVESPGIPPPEAFFALGSKLNEMWLRRLIQQVPDSLTKGILETCRGNRDVDKAHLTDLLEETMRQGYWPAVRGDLRKFGKLVGDEVVARNGASATSREGDPTQGEGPSPKPPHSPPSPTPVNGEENVSETLSAYYAEVRAFEETHWHPRYQNGWTIGSSLWDAHRDRLDAIDKKHGIRPGDPRIYSIAAYLDERRQIEREWECLRRDKHWESAGSEMAYYKEYFAAQMTYEMRQSDCTARHFPRLNLGFVDTIANLWALVRLRLLPCHELAELHPDKQPSEPINRDLQRVYRQLHELRIPWAPAPPYAALKPGEAYDALLSLANRLEKEEQERCRAERDLAAAKLFDHGSSEWADQAMQIRPVTLPGSPSLSPAPLKEGQSDGTRAREGETPDNRPDNHGRASRWLSLAHAARLSGINQGVISRAVDSGEIQSNGLKGKGKRKIDSADFNRWHMKRSERPERTETDAEVERKLRRHAD
jgi:hypothetical protein